MVFTVTLNPAIDKTVVIPGFHPGKVNRIRSLRTDAGGKGINVSKCLTNLSLETVAAGIFGGSAGTLHTHCLNFIIGIPNACGVDQT